MAHKSHEALQSELDAAREKVEVGALYYHFRHPDQFYVLAALGFIEATEEVAVCYRALYGNGFLWIRPISVFLEEVDVDGRRVPRFSKVLTK